MLVVKNSADNQIAEQAMDDFSATYGDNLDFNSENQQLESQNVVLTIRHQLSQLQSLTGQIHSLVADLKGSLKS